MYIHFQSSHTYAFSAWFIPCLSKKHLFAYVCQSSPHTGSKVIGQFKSDSLSVYFISSYLSHFLQSHFKKLFKLQNDQSLNVHISQYSQFSIIHQLCVHGSFSSSCIHILSLSLFRKHHVRRTHIINNVTNVALFFIFISFNIKII